MAFLLDVAAETCFPLAPHHTFGRLVTSVNTHIDKAFASKLHAAIDWNGCEWRIKHLGLNGTWVNTILLSQGEAHSLAIGDIIRIADPNDPGFKVINLAPPADMLWPLDTLDSQQIQPIYLDRFNLLPDAQTPEIAVYFDDTEQQWYSEVNQPHSDSTKMALDNNTVMTFASSRWQFIRAQVYGPTEIRSPQQQTLADLEFMFQLSLDEETTQLMIQPLGANVKHIDLGARTHHYLLLQLARHRAEHAQRGFDTASQGWIYADQLASELGLDNTHMNIQIFRARKQFSDSFPTVINQQLLVERLGAKIRFGGENFKIYKGATLTFSAPAAPQLSTTA